MKEKDFREWAVKWVAPAAFALYLLLKPQSAWSTPAAGQQYDAAFQQAEERYSLPAGLLSRIAYQESRYDPAAVSQAGALGLMQFMPGTAADYGIDPLDPYQSIDATGRYLRWLFGRLGSWRLALAAYNFGIGNVERGRSWPAETVAYVSDISKDVGLT